MIDRLTMDENISLLDNLSTQEDENKVSYNTHTRAAPRWPSSASRGTHVIEWI